MKFMLLFFLSYLIVYGQNPHLYYPHHVGNMWQYIDDEGIISNEKFLRDSVDENGNTFVNTIENPAFPQLFFWGYKFNPTGDTIYEQPNSYNYLVYKFPMDSGDVWIADSVQVGIIARVENKFDLLVFGRPTTVFYIAYYQSTTFAHWLWWEEIALGLGRLRWGDEVSYKNLIGCIINGDTIGTILSSNDNIDFQPSQFELSQNYPNPFNPETKIKFSTSRPGLVNLTVYDLLGREVEILVNEYRNSGTYETTFNSKNLASGIYIYLLRAGNNVLSKKMILMK